MSAQATEQIAKLILHSLTTQAKMVPQAAPPPFNNSQSAGYGMQPIVNSQLPMRALPGQLPNMSGTLGPMGNQVVSSLWELSGARAGLVANARDRKMLLGPIGSGTWNARDIFETQNAMSSFGTMAAQGQNQDLKQIRRFAMSMTQMQHPNQSPKQVKAIVDEGMKFAAANIGYIPPEMLDRIMPGGSATVFGQNMMRAKIAQRPGRIPSGEDMADLLTEFEGDFTKDGTTSEDTSFTRGFTRGQFGQMGVELGRRGLLKGGKSQAVAQLKETADALDAVRDFIGDPNAPIPQLIASLERLTGQGVGQTNLKQLTGQVRRLRVIGQDLGMSSQAMGTFVQGIAAQSEGLGLSPVIAARSAEETMNRARGAWEALEANSAPKFGRMTRQDSLRSSQVMTLRGAGSRHMARVAALSQLYGNREASGGFRAIDPNATDAQKEQFFKLNDYIRKSRNGSLTDAENREFQKMTRDPALYPLMAAAGVDRSILGSTIRNKFIVNEQLNKYGFQGQIASAQQADIEGTMNKALANPGGAGRIAEKAIRAGAATQADGTTKIRAMRQKMTRAFLSANSVKAGEMAARAVLSTYVPEGTTEDEREQRQALLSDSMTQWKTQLGSRRNRNLMGVGQNVDIYDAFYGAASDKARQGAAVVAARTRTSADIDQIFAAAGVGRQQAGLGGLMRNAFNAIADAKPGDDVNKILLQSLGAGDTKQARAAIESARDKDGGKIQKTISRLQELSEAMAKFKNVVGASAAQEKENQDRKKEYAVKQKELAESLKVFGDALKGLKLGGLREESSTIAKSIRTIRALESGGEMSGDDLLKVEDAIGKAVTSKDFLKEAERIGGKKGLTAAIRMQKATQRQYADLLKEGKKKGGYHSAEYKKKLAAIVDESLVNMDELTRGDSAKAMAVQKALDEGTADKKPTTRTSTLGKGRQRRDAQDAAADASSAEFAARDAAAEDAKKQAAPAPSTAKEKDVPPKTVVKKDEGTEVRFSFTNENTNTEFGSGTMRTG